MNYAYEINWDSKVTKNLRFLECEFELDFSDLKTLQFQFGHIFWNLRISRINSKLGLILCKHYTLRYARNTNSK